MIPVCKFAFWMVLMQNTLKAVWSVANRQYFNLLQRWVVDSPVRSTAWFEGSSRIGFEFVAGGFLGLIFKSQLRCSSRVFSQLLDGWPSSQRWHRPAADSFRLLSFRCSSRVFSRLLDVECNINSEFPNLHKMVKPEIMWLQDSHNHKENPWKAKI